MYPSLFPLRLKRPWHPGVSSLHGIYYFQQLMTLVMEFSFLLLSFPVIFGFEISLNFLYSLIMMLSLSGQN